MDVPDWSLMNPVSPVFKVKHYQKPLYFNLKHSYIHTRISFHTPEPPGRLGHEPPGGSGTKHRTCSEMHQNALCCATKRRLASFNMSNQIEPGEKTVDEHRAALAWSGRPGHLNLLVRS